MERLDYDLVQQLRTDTGQRLRDERRRRAEAGERLLSPDDEREFGRSLIAAAVEAHRRDQLVNGSAALPPAEVAWSEVRT
jgi:hypothetical protein